MPRWPALLIALFIVNEGVHSKSKFESKPSAQIVGHAIKELSGVTNADRSGEFWGHSDRGNEPLLYRFNLAGKILQTVALIGVKNEDLEAITRDASGNLYVGGFGDNDLKRKNYHIYEIHEPAYRKASSSKTQVSAGKKSIQKKSHPSPVNSNAVKTTTFTFHYSDNKSHNCEAFFIWNERFYLITKVEGKHKQPRIYRIDKLMENETVIAQDLGPFRIEGAVTDAAYSANHKLLAVLTYSTLAFYPLAQESDLLASPFRSRNIDFGQCEGLCFDGDRLVITNEKGDLWIYPLDFFMKD